MGYSVFHMFAGAGGGILADLLLGHRTVGAIEIEAYPRQVLIDRQLDGSLPQFPIWDDVRTFSYENADTRSYIDWLRERRDSLVIAAGFPCQDLSVAGNQAGVGEGTRSGLYREVLRIADVVRPQYLFLENVPAILAPEWLGTVLGDLAARGYDARWTCLPASAAGAPHYRDRWWCLAERSDANCERKLQPEGCESEQRGWTGDVGEDVAYTSSEGLQTGRRSRLEKSNAETGPRMEHESKRCCTDVADAMLLSQQGEKSGSFDAQERAQSGERQAGSRGNGVGWWAVEPGLDRVANGVPNRAHRIKAIGNAQVPIQAVLAWIMLGGPCENP